MTEKEPWRIDKGSVHWRVLKGWLSERFRGWLEKKAIEFNIPSDDLLVEIIETIRKISWLTLNILEEETGRKVYLPFTVILDAPLELSGLEVAIWKNNSPDFFCNQEKVRDELRIQYLRIWMLRIHHFSSELNGGYIRAGASCDVGVAIYDRVIMNLLDKSSLKDRKIFLQIIAEEILHYYYRQIDKLSHRKMQSEVRQAIQGVNDLGEQQRIISQIETKYGIKIKKDGLIKILEKQNKDLLFSLSKRTTKDTS